MIEGALVHILSATPPHAFIGCGAVIEGGLIATCRHVWRDAVKNAADGALPIAEFPRVDGDDRQQSLRLVAACDHESRAPDLVLLEPAALPSGTPALMLSTARPLEVGAAACRARLSRGGGRWAEITVRGTLDEALDPEGRRQFTGQATNGYWFARGSSGSPVFQDGARHLAAILSLSEIKAEDDTIRLQEAFVVPGTLIRRHAMRLAALPAAEAEGIDPARLDDILATIGADGAPVREIPDRLQSFVAAIRARPAEPSPATNDGTDIDAVIGAARDKVGRLDAAGALAVIEAKIAEEREAQEVQRRGMLRLLRERLAIERLTFAHDATRVTLTAILEIDPESVGDWIALGDIHRTVGASGAARAAFTRARDLALEEDPQGRDVFLASERLGLVLLSQGNAAAALAEYRKAMAIAARLAASDPGQAARQRDLSVSHNKIGDVLLGQGDAPGALAEYRKAMAIRERLAASDPGQAEWQRDLSVSHSRIGDVLRGQGDAPGALVEYRKGMAITERLAASDPGQAEWQRDLSVSHSRIGDVLLRQGDAPGALAEYRTAMAIAERLAASDPGQAEWQRDLSISHNRIGDVLLRQGDAPGALAEYRKAMAIAERLVASDPRQAEWQRDLSVSHNKIGDVLLGQGDAPGALVEYRKDMAIAERLAATDPGQVEWQRDLIVSLWKLADADASAAVAHITRALAIARALADTGRLAPVDAWMIPELERRLRDLGAPPA